MPYTLVAFAQFKQGSYDIAVFDCGGTRINWYVSRN